MAEFISGGKPYVKGKELHEGGAYEVSRVHVMQKNLWKSSSAGSDRIATFLNE